jgi:hypothetical protein
MGKIEDVKTEESELSREKLISQLVALAKPIDLAELEKQGVIVKERGPWWRVLNLSALPHDVRVKVRAMRIVPSLNRLSVKFCPPSAIAGAARLLRRVRPADAITPLPHQRSETDAPKM